MAVIKTRVTWDHVQTEEELEIGRLKGYEMTVNHLTDGFVMTVSEPGAALIVKERNWVSEEAAQQWVDFVLALEIPPVSAVVVVE